MNAVDLDVREAVVVPGWVSDAAGGATPGERAGRGATPGERAPLGGRACRVELDPDEERIAFVTSEPLEPGRVTLACAFDGVLNDRCAASTAASSPTRTASSR